MCRKRSQRGAEWIVEGFWGATIATLRSGRLHGLLAQMPKAKANKGNHVKGAAFRQGESVLRRTRGRRRRWKWILIVFVVLLLIPAVQVAVVRFVDPPRTVPMWIEQVSSSAAKGPLRYRWIPLGQMPEMFLKHLWISEDQRFFRHYGFDWEEMDRAMEKAEKTGKPVRGASTITNQCARSIFLWQGRSWVRKGLESYYTIWMELLLPKRRILELYANVIEMGRGIYGVEAASQYYFGVSARGLTREQSAMLAAVLPNPKRWDPRNPGMRLRWRQQLILRREEKVRFPAKLIK